LVPIAPLATMKCGHQFEIYVIQSHQPMFGDVSQVKDKTINNNVIHQLVSVQAPLDTRLYIYNI